jgi:hypothetical protein
LGELLDSRNPIAALRRELEGLARLSGTTACTPALPLVESAACAQRRAQIAAKREELVHARAGRDLRAVASVTKELRELVRLSRAAGCPFDDVETFTEGAAL